MKLSVVAVERIRMKALIEVERITIVDAQRLIRIEGIESLWSGRVIRTVIEEAGIEVVSIFSLIRKCLFSHLRRGVESYLPWSEWCQAFVLDVFKNINRLSKGICLVKFFDNIRPVRRWAQNPVAHTWTEERLKRFGEQDKKTRKPFE